MSCQNKELPNDHQTLANLSDFTSSKGASLLKYFNLSKGFARWWFQIFFLFTSIWGRFPFWLIFFKWVETTNQICYVGFSWTKMLDLFAWRDPRPQVYACFLIWKKPRKFKSRWQALGLWVKMVQFHGQMVRWFFVVFWVMFMATW